MGEVVRLAAHAAAPIQRGCNVDENARSGYRLVYRSMKNAPWYRDSTKKAVMLHLILEVAHERRSVVFGRNRVQLCRGQLVCSAKSLGLDLNLSPDQVRGALDYFEREGAISRQAKEGKGGYTLVTLVNFDPYQRGVSQHVSDELSAEFDSASELGLAGDELLGDTELNTESQAEDYISKNIQNIKDLKHSSSQLADASFDQQSEQLISAEPVSAEQATTEPDSDEPKTRVIPEAAIQTPNGKAWGTAEDLKTAQWMFARVQRINPTALEPNWPQWANVIRLMRELDLRSHSDICELYDWVSRDPFWCANVLSPQKLRQKWDQLTAKRNAAPLHNKRPLGNLAAAQQQAQAIMANSGVGYDDETIL